MNVVDLFSGCGGFSLGAHAAGLAPKIAFDIDADLTSSFGMNYPNTRLILADLAKISGVDIERQLGGRVDGMFGGPPCQGFSDIGHRSPEDPRRLLLGHFFRLVSELRPAFFVLENVKGLSYFDAKPLLDKALDLVAGDYELVGPVILDAADFGAATRRPRLFVIGYDSTRMDVLTLRDIELAKSPCATVRDAIGDLSNAEPVGEEDRFDLWRISADRPPSSYSANLRSAGGLFSGHRRTSHTQAVAERFAAVTPGGVDSIGRHPRLHWDGQCPTLRAGTGTDKGSFQSVRPIHPEEARVITVREAARLQGFPDWFRFHPTVWHSFRMIGNSVSPIISQVIFSLIAQRVETGLAAKLAAE